MTTAPGEDLRGAASALARLAGGPCGLVGCAGCCLGAVAAGLARRPVCACRGARLPPPRRSLGASRGAGCGLIRPGARSGTPTLRATHQCEHWWALGTAAPAGAPALAVSAPGPAALVGGGPPGAALVAVPLGAAWRAAASPAVLGGRRQNTAGPLLKVPQKKNKVNPSKKTQFPWYGFFLPAAAASGVDFAFFLWFGVGAGGPPYFGPRFSGCAAAAPWFFVRLAEGLCAPRRAPRTQKYKHPGRVGAYSFLVLWPVGCVF